MTVSIELIKQLHVLAHGRLPSFSEQAQSDSPPSSLTDGVDVDGAVVAHVATQLREDAGHWRTRLSLNAYDSAQDYTLVLDGRDYVRSGNGDSEADFLTAFAADITGAGGGPLEGTYDDVNGELVVSSNIGGDGGPFLVEFRTTGATTLVQSPEATRARLIFWALPVNRTVWHRLRDIHAQEFDGLRVENNWTNRLIVAGYQRLFVQTQGRDGLVRHFIGPGQLETT